MTINIARNANPFLSLVVFFLTMMFTVAVFAEEKLAELHVRGEARLMVAPDQVSVVLGVTSESSSAKKAIASNNRKMNNIIRALQLLGLDDSDYKTRRFNVQPIWSSRPKGADKQWSSKIVAYRVDNSLHVTTQQLDILGELIAATTEAGANQVNSIRFSLADPRQYRAKVIASAMENAKADAYSLAEASGDKIARTLSLRLDNAAASVSRPKVAAMQSRMMMDSVVEFAPPIDAGDITVSASVSVVYQLAESESL